MVIAYHLILSFYGFWLPNDPRGSWSEVVRATHLLRFGPATKVRTRRSVAHQQHDQQQRLAAKAALKYPPVVLTGRQARAVGRGFAQAGNEAGYAAVACSIMPDHVHLVIRRHDKAIEQIARHLKARATQQLTREELRPASGGPVWAKGRWAVYLDNDRAVRRASRYVQRNPIMAGLPRQTWSFVTGTSSADACPSDTPASGASGE